MTDLLQQAVERVRTLPPETQDDLARFLLRLAGDASGHVVLSSDEQVAIMASKSAAARGDFATEEDVQAVWARHGP